jgi:hypothetical protein
MGQWSCCARIDISTSMLWTDAYMSMYTVGNDTVCMMRGMVDEAEANLGGVLSEGIFGVSS